jgi:hypothetical protein
MFIHDSETMSKPATMSEIWIGRRREGRGGGGAGHRRITSQRLSLMVAVAPGVRVLELLRAVVGLDVEEVGGQRPGPAVGGSVARQ